MYEDIYFYISDLFNDEQSNDWLDRNRISAKVSQLSDAPDIRQHLANEDVLRPPHMFMPYQKFKATRRMDSQSESRMMDDTDKRDGHIREASYTVGGFGETNDQQFTVMYVGPRQFSSKPVPHSVPESHGETLEELFDFDSVLYESLGIHRNQAKEWTPINCAKEYTINIFKRMILDFLLGTH